MDLNKKGKKYVDIVRKNGSEEIFALVDEVNSALEDNIDNFKKDSGIELELEESLEKKLDSDNEPLNLLVPEANYHVVGNPTIKKSWEEITEKK